MRDDLSPDSIARLLTTRRLGRTLHLLGHTDSTNSAATRLAQQGAPHGTVVCADHQTAGRGRRGRSWHAVPGESVCCSILLRSSPPEFTDTSWLSWIPLASAVGAAAGIRRAASVDLILKWPNDLLVNARKIGGLLCENIASIGLPPILIVGIGLNVNMGQTDFPAELQSTATSLRLATGRIIDRGLLLAQMLNELEARLDAVMRQDLAPIREEYRRSCGTIGKRVRVELPEGQRLEGIVQGLAVSGALLVRTDHPTGRTDTPDVVEVLAGDVVHLRDDGSEQDAPRN